MDNIDVGTQGGEPWLGVLQQLMPRGIAWNHGCNSQQTKLLAPLASALASTDSECASVALEMQLGSTLLLLSEYEQYFGLPECADLAPTVAARRNNLITKDKLNGGLAIWQIEQLAADLGFEITVQEIWPHHCLRSCIAPLNAAYWRHTLKVTVLNMSNAYFTCVDTILTPLVNNDARILECALNKYKMAGKYYDITYTEDA